MNTGFTKSRQVQLVEGLRGPQHAPEAGLLLTQMDVPSLQPVPWEPDGEPKPQRMFRSTARKYIQHLGKRPDRYDDKTGTLIPGFEFSAFFDEYCLLLPAYFSSHAIPFHERDEFIRRLEQNPAKGIYYEESDKIAAMIEEEDAQVAEAMLERNPALLERLIAKAAAARGFDLSEVKRKLKKADKRAAAVEKEEEEDEDEDQDDEEDEVSPTPAQSAQSLTKIPPSTPPGKKPKPGDRISL